MYNDYYNQNRFNPSYMQQPYMNYQTPPQQTNTNKIYVGGVDDVRNRNLSPNSDFIFLDNDKPLLYQKTVDSKGQFEVKTFTITPYQAEEIKPESSVDLSIYAKASDLDAIKKELQVLKNSIGGQHGTTGSATTKV